MSTIQDALSAVSDKLSVASPKTKATADYEYHCFNERRRVFGFVGDKLVTRVLNPFEVRKAKSDGIAIFHTIPTGGFPLQLPLGLVALIGATKSGKSSLIEALSEVVAVDHKLVVEPFDSATDAATRFAYSEADDALATTVFQHRRMRAEDPRAVPLFVLDSLRAPVYETQGTAGSKGVIKAFFTMLTRVSNSLAADGITVVATVNPMEDNDQTFSDAFTAMATSALPAVINLTSVDKTGWAGKLVVRDKDSPDHRRERSFAFTRGASARAPAQVEVYTMPPAEQPALELFSAVELNSLTQE